MALPPPRRPQPGAAQVDHSALLQILVFRKALTREQADRVRRHARANAIPIASTIVRLGLASEIQIGEALAAFAGIRFVKINPLASSPWDNRRLVIRREISTTPEALTDRESDRDVAWNIVLGAARAAERLAQADRLAAFALANDAQFRPVPAGDPDAVIAWRPGNGWDVLLPTADPRHGLIDLYLPICSATAGRPVTVGHLGQSLDGFIATHAGESRWVTGEENILHLHRLRALCDAVVVGAGTVAADDPQLTTRLVAGGNPLRVVLDPTRRLGAHHRVFSDDSADTIYVCARSLIRPGESQFGRAAIWGVEEGAGGVDVVEVLRRLRARACTRVFVEGGGVTVSTFLEAGLLDRLHLAIAPLLIGDGRPAIRLPPRAVLTDCHRPQYRVFRMGGDVLFDCDLGSPRKEADNPPDSPIGRII